MSNLAYLAAHITDVSVLQTIADCRRDPREARNVARSVVESSKFLSGFPLNEIDNQVRYWRAGYLPLGTDGCISE